MAVSLRMLTVGFFFLFVALAVSDKISSEKEDSNSASAEDVSSSDERSSEEDASCEDEITTQLPSESTTTSTTAAPIISPSELCRSKTNGNYINANDCKSYIACSNGYAYVMPCPANLVYNEEGWCDYVQNVPRCM